MTTPSSEETARFAEVIADARSYGSDVATAESYWMGRADQGYATVLLSPLSSGCDAFSAGTHELPAGGHLPERCFSRGDFIALVLEGQASAHLDGVEHAMGVGATLAVGRGVPHSISNPGSTSASLLWFSVPCGYEELLRSEGEPRTPGQTLRPDFEAQAAPARDFFAHPKGLLDRASTGGTARIIPEDERASFWQGLPTTGYADVIVSPYNYPSNAFALGSQTLSPGAMIPPHAHARNEEFLYIARGRGVCTTRAGDLKVSAGQSIHVSRWFEHGLRADDDSELSLVWMFSPPGLDAFLAEIGRPRTPGEPAPEPFPPPPTIFDLMKEAGFAFSPPGH